MLDFPLGATPIHDSSGLKLPWIKSKIRLDAAEAESILKAVSKYFSQRKFPLSWFNEKTLKKIHADMFGEVWDWAGTYYQGPLRNIGINSAYIPHQLRELCQDVQFWLQHKTDLSFLEQSARIHARLAQIHPFPNGNGRHARLTADLYLFSAGGTRPHWPEQIITSNTNLRKEYIQSLKNADRGDYSDLLHLIIKYGGGNPGN